MKRLAGLLLGLTVGGRFGLQPRMVLQPDFSRVELSAWMAAYFNGEVFPKYRGRDLPVASLDFGGLYVAMHETIGAWELQSAKRIRIYQRNPDDVTRYLKRIARKVNRWLNNPTSRSPLTFTTAFQLACNKAANKTADNIKGDTRGTFDTRGSILSIITL